ncbi:MAG: hypothetical protein DBY37_13350 [Desulfovibrionaceae bacterium]|nr:MAG: hypothetical protein DBY37_13350 [Desulfovibrionaceae bacterium]
MKKKLLSPVNDHVFKRVFGKHLRVLAGFLSAVLEMPIDASDIRVLDPNFRAERDDDKLGVLDVKVETRNGVIDVEVQVQPHLHLKKRLLYYTSRMFVEQIDKGQNYGKLTRAVSIMIVDFELIKTDSAFHHRYRLYDQENRLEYSDALEINVLEIPKVQKDETSPVSAWLRFFAAKTEDEFMSLAQTSPAMEEAWGVIKELSADERERLLAEDREKTRRDNAAYYETGLVEGIATGVEKGRAEGRMEERKNLVANMLAQGVSPEQISSFTGLTLGDVKALAGRN